MTAPQPDLDALSRLVRNAVLEETGSADMRDLVARHPSVAALLVTLDIISSSIEHDFFHIVNALQVRAAIEGPRANMGLPSLKRED